MIITLYEFSKRKNSTKQPTGGTDVDVKLKENTTVDSPVFIVQGNRFSVTYVKAFNQYYWVTSVTSLANGLCEIACKIDVLATYKNAIAGSSQFVLRSTSAYNDLIADNYVSMRQNYSFSTQLVDTGLFDSVGTYVLSVLNNIGSGAGFTTYYLMTPTQIAALAQYCNQNLADTSSITDIIQWIQATFLKTADAVIDCKWLPVSLGVSLVGGGVSTGEVLRVGKDDVAGVTGNRCTGPIIRTANYNIIVPHKYSDFRKGSPYSNGLLYLPMYGCYQFNPLDFPDVLTVRYDVDVITGDCTIFLMNHARIIATITCNMSVTMPVGKVGNNAGGTVASALGAVAGTVAAFATEGASTVVAGIGASASAINAITSAAAISPSAHGIMGGRSMTLHGLGIQCIIIASDTSDPSNLTQIVGRPTMQYRSLSGLSGYVQCSEASVSVSANDTERDEINNFLNSGFYLE